MRIARKCSYCGKLGHNARTCKNVSHGQLKLFGVQLDIYSSSSSSSNSFSSSPPSYSATKTSFSTNYLFSSSESLSSSYSSPSLFGTNGHSDSYLVSAEDSLSSLINNLDTNKGVAWTEEEHRVFLIGLEKLGKGNWRGISTSYVTTRTPTQVASHAQKYFLRQSHSSFNTRKKRPSLFDVGMKVKPHSIQSQLTSNGIFVSQCLSHCRSTSTNYALESAPPDLELKLATPTPLDLTYACSAPGHLS